MDLKMKPVKDLSEDHLLWNVHWTRHLHGSSKIKIKKTHGHPQRSATKQQKIE